MPEAKISSDEKNYGIGNPCCLVIQQMKTELFIKPSCLQFLRIIFSFSGERNCELHKITLRHSFQLNATPIYGEKEICRYCTEY